MNTLNSKSRAKYILLAGMLSLGNITVSAVSSPRSEVSASYAVTQQNQTVKGVVIDKSTGEPIIGANIIVERNHPGSHYGFRWKL